MKAQNLTISVPGDKCDKDCKYCISKITWQPDNNMSVMSDNLQKVKNLAYKTGITNVMFTSKREPFLNINQMLWLMRRFEDYWLEVQTNGIQLNKYSGELAKELMRVKVNVVAFSIDNMKDLAKYEDTFATLAQFGIITRVCFNMTNIITSKHGFYSIMEEVIKRRDKQGVPFIRQVLFRNINYPSTAPAVHPTVKWIDENVNPAHYKSIVEQAKRAGMKKIRVVPHTGTEIYSYKKLTSVCFSDYCIQETNKTDDIRSVILQSDGHVYTSWDDPSSILF